MAHHVADLMERASTATTKTGRTVATDECARLIESLWQLRRDARGQDGLTLIQRALKAFGEHAAETGDLADAVSRSRANRGLGRLAPAKRWSLLSQLNRVEWQLLRLADLMPLLAPSAGLPDGLVEGLVSHVSADLVQVLPEMAALDAKHPRRGLELLKAACRTLEAIRAQLL